ncbi:MAG: SIS domain-containing protein [Eubacteriales bacterium]
MYSFDDKQQRILETLITVYPALSESAQSIRDAVKLCSESFENGGRLYICGNGGSAADSAHITGELMKSFKFHRGCPAKLKASLSSLGDKSGGNMSQLCAALTGKLEGALPAYQLTESSALMTAVANDSSADMIFAQQLCGYARPGDVLLALTTSGNSKNCIYAALTAAAAGAAVISMTGEGGGEIAKLSEVSIKVPAHETYAVQEYHLPVYHAFCAMLESYFFGM